MVKSECQVHIILDMYELKCQLENVRFFNLLLSYKKKN